MQAIRVAGALAAALAVMALGGCSGVLGGPDGPAPGGSGGGPLTSRTWECYEFSVEGVARPVAADAPITAEFGADGRVAGSAGVNSYSTAYETSGNTITLDPQIVTTEMAGPPAVMSQEAAYLAMLPTVTAYSIDQRGHLLVFDARDSIVGRYKPVD